MANSNFRPHHISFSQIQMYENCPQCYQLNYVMGVYPAEKPEAFSFGTIFHLACAYHYKGNDFWKGFEAGLLKENITDKRIQHKYREAIRLMWDHYLVFGKQYKGSKVEHEFQVQLRNPITGKYLAVPMKGVIDLITTDEWVVDHKTSSVEYGDESREAPQLLIYSMAYRALFGKPPKGLAFSIFRKDSKVGLWQEYPVQVDEMAEAILWMKIKVTLDKILANDWTPKMAKWPYKHHPMCEMAFIKH